MNSCNISCELHDYIEIACLYHYRLKLKLKDGQIIEGKAMDTMTSDDKREYLLIDNPHKPQIELNSLAQLQVLTPNARFSTVNFK